MQVKAEEAELERHGHDEPRMLFGDIPPTCPHYCHCEADKDAYDERAHAQQRFLLRLTQTIARMTSVP